MHDALPSSACRATRSEQIALTEAITQCTKWQQLDTLLAEHKADLGPVNFAAMYTQLSKLAPAPERQRWEPADAEAFGAFYARLAYAAGRSMHAGMGQREVATISR
jgi:hypothetical protein